MRADTVIQSCPVIGAAVGGLIAWMGGFSIGTGIGVGFCAGLAPLALLFLAALVIRMNSDRPPCKCGHCPSQQYEFLRMTARPDGEHDFFYRCPHCGRTWKALGNVFYEVGDDGKESPYMKSNWRQTWRPVDKP